MSLRSYTALAKERDELAASLAAKPPLPVPTVAPTRPVVAATTPVPVPPTAKPAEAPRTHTVVMGDTLTRIALRYYGNATFVMSIPVGSDERQRQRIEAMERTHERLAVREREVPTDAPAPAEPGPQPAAILDRFELEDVIAMCSRKKAYPSQVDAERVAARCFRERGARLRVYACPACCRYHLTKQLAAPATRAA